MALQTPIRSPGQTAPAHPTAPAASWPEPPRAAVAAAVATAADSIAGSGVRFETEWVNAPGRGAPAPIPTPTLSPAPVLSPGLARLLNAALVDSTFAAHFLSSPVEAAQLATETSGDVFGTALPSSALRLTLPALSDAEWTVLHRLPRAESLAAAAQELRRLAAPTPTRTVTYDAPHAAPPAEPAYAAALHEVTPSPLRPLRAPSSPEGALAGAA